MYIILYSWSLGSRYFVAGTSTKFRCQNKCSKLEFDGHVYKHNLTPVLSEALLVLLISSLVAFRKA